MDDDLTLVVAPAGRSAVDDEGTDRLGGVGHGAAERAVKAVKSVSWEDFASQLRRIVSQTKLITEQVEAGIGAYEAREIAIGLAVTGEGTIGVATVGVEASISVTLRRRSSGEGE